MPEPPNALALKPTTPGAIVSSFLASPIVFAVVIIGMLGQPVKNPTARDAMAVSFTCAAILLVNIVSLGTRPVP